MPRQTGLNHEAVHHLRRGYLTDTEYRALADALSVADRLTRTGIAYAFPPWRQSSGAPLQGSEHRGDRHGAPGLSVSNRPLIIPGRVETESRLN